MKTIISMQVTKVTKENVSMEIEFPIYYRMGTNIFHRFENEKRGSLCVYTGALGWKIESDCIPIKAILEGQDYESCTGEQFYEAYAEARYAMDTMIDFQQLYLTNNLPEDGII